MIELKKFSELKIGDIIKWNSPQYGIIFGVKVGARGFLCFDCIEKRNDPFYRPLVEDYKECSTINQFSEEEDDFWLVGHL